MDKAFDAATKQFGRIDVVCNNAGYGLAGEFESVTEEQSRKQMEVNFFGLLKVTRRAMKIMRETNKPAGGKIQQVTSIGGQRGVPFFSIYCASKWAVEGLTEAINKELKPEWYVADLTARENTSDLWGTGTSTLLASSLAVSVPTGQAVAWSLKMPRSRRTTI